MSKTRFTQWIALACIGTLAACTSGEGGTAGNTEVNVIVPNNGSQSPDPNGDPQPSLIDIQDVEYTVDCQGNNDVFLDNNASFPDEVTLNGNLEVQDGRTNAAAIYGDPAIDGQAEIWQGFMDLPPGPCTIELRARDDDGEVICTAQEPFIIAADSTTKVNIVLICDISFQAPVGMLDVDGTFSFNVGNFCPDLFILNCLDSFPEEQQVLPPPNPPLAGTGCQVRFRDGDSSCGAGCDPQNCVPNGTSGLTCTPGPDPGVSTTVTCTDAWLDCEGDGTPDPSCTFTGDTVGDLAQQPPSFPGVPGNGGFFVTCIPPSLGGAPGATAVCTAVTTDGDLDCDKTKVVEVQCFGETPCFVYGLEEGLIGDGDLACQAAAGTACLTSICDNTLNVGGSCSGGVCCVDSPVPDGTDCSAENPPLAVCQGGVCAGSCCASDADCDSGEQCTSIFPGSCDVGSCLCLPEQNDPAGTACDAGVGASSGACDGAGSCVDICSFNPACPDDGNVCTAASCDPVDGTCGQAPANDGGTCDFFFPGAADGTCVGGTCFNSGNPCGTISGTVQIGCTNGVTDAQSPFPNQMQITENGTIFAGQPFTVDVSGIGAFPKFFLDAAQGTVPGGVRSAVVEGFNVTVEAVNGTGQILLQADPSGITPGLTQFCQYPTSTVCTQDSDCIVPPCNPPVLLAGVPLSEDCSVGGVCEGLGQGPNDGATAQCNITSPPSFCVTGDLLVPLYAPGGPQVMTAGASGNVSFNWAVDPATETCGTSTSTRCAANGGTLPDGALILPPSIYGDPVGNPASIGLNGIRLNVANALFVALQCSAGSDGGACVAGANAGIGCANDGQCPGSTCAGVGVDDDIIVDTPVADLPFCPIN